MFIKKDTKKVGRYTVTTYLISLFSKVASIELRIHENSCPLWPLVFFLSALLSFSLFVMANDISEVQNNIMNFIASISCAIAIFSFGYGMDKMLNQ